jgi:hypothetical protein
MTFTSIYRSILRCGTTTSQSVAVMNQFEPSASMIICDCGPATGDWTGPIVRVRWASEEPCIVMAAGLVSEELWQDALFRRIYDVVCRIEHGRQLVATLQFAWKWRADRRSHDMRGPGGRKVYNAHSNKPQVCRLHGYTRIFYKIITVTLSGCCILKVEKTYVQTGFADR